MEGTPQKPKICRFCRARSFAGSHFQGPCGFPGFPASGIAEMEGTPQKPKTCRFCRVRSFSGSHFQDPCGFAGFPASGTAEMEGTPQKPKTCRFCRVLSFSGSHFQGPVDFLDFLLLGPPKWREPQKSPKFVDFIEPVESAPFPQAISKAPVDFPGFPASGAAEMEGTPQKPKICRFCRVHFSGSHFQGPF